MKRIVRLMTLVFVLGCVCAFAQVPVGYFAESPAVLTIPGGPTTNPGPAVDLDSIIVPAGGSFLITARVDGQSYGPNSGAVCFFTGPTEATQWNYQTLNTSSDWVHLATASTVMLGKYTASVAGKVTLTCQKGYLFTNSSLFKGTLMLIPVGSLSH